MLATLRANLLATALGILAAILLAISVYQGVVIDGFLWVDGLKDKVETITRDNNELRAELKAISDAKNEQRATTGKAIEQAERIAKDADGVARGIEEAPLSGDCRTPDEIMRAGI